MFLEEVERDDLAALWTLLLMTGLGPGEALGLKWDDLTGDRLTVRRALVRSAEGAWELAETKTRRGRTVTLPGRSFGRWFGTAPARVRTGSYSVGSIRGLAIFAATFGQPL